MEMCRRVNVGFTLLCCTMSKHRYLQEPDDGGLFMATTVNGFRNVSFDRNLYFVADASTAPTFPCTGPPPSVLVPGTKMEVLCSSMILKAVASAPMSAPQPHPIIVLFRWVTHYNRRTGRQQPFCKGTPTFVSILLLALSNFVRTM